MADDARGAGPTDPGDPQCLSTGKEEASSRINSRVRSTTCFIGTGCNDDVRCRTGVFSSIRTSANRPQSDQLTRSRSGPPGNLRVTRGLTPILG